MKKVRVQFADGSEADIDESEVSAALKAGAKILKGEAKVQVKFQDGSIGDVSESQKNDALQAGATILKKNASQPVSTVAASPSSATPSTSTASKDNRVPDQRFVNAISGDFIDRDLAGFTLTDYNKSQRGSLLKAADQATNNLSLGNLDEKGEQIDVQKIKTDPQALLAYKDKRLAEIDNEINAAYSRPSFEDNPMMLPLDKFSIGDQSQAEMDRINELVKQKQELTKSATDRAAAMLGGSYIEEAPDLEKNDGSTKLIYKPLPKEIMAAPESRKEAYTNIGKEIMKYQSPADYQSLKFDSNIPYLKQSALFAGIDARAKYLESAVNDIVSRVPSAAQGKVAEAMGRFADKKETKDDTFLLQSLGLKSSLDDIRIIGKDFDNATYEFPEIRKGFLKKAIFNELDRRFGSNQGGLLYFGTQGWSEGQMKAVINDYKKSLPDNRDDAILDGIMQEKELGVLSGDNQSWASKMRGNFLGTLYDTGDFMVNRLSKSWLRRAGNAALARDNSSVDAYDQANKRENLEEFYKNQSGIEGAEGLLGRTFTPDRKSFGVENFIESNPEDEKFLQQKKNEGQVDGSLIGKVFYNSASQFGQLAAQAVMAYGIPEVGAVGFNLSKAAAPLEFIANKGLTFGAKVAAPAFAMSFENNYKDSYGIVGTKDEWKNNLYATLLSSFEGATEALGNPMEQMAFVKSSFKKGIGGLIKNLTTEEIEKMGEVGFRDRLKSAASEAIKGLGKGVVEQHGEAAEEYVNAWAGGVTQMIFNPQSTNLSEINSKATNTYLQTFASMGFMPILGVTGGARRGWSNRMSQKGIALIGANPEASREFINGMLDNGDYTQQEANQKIKLVNTAQLALQQSYSDLAKLSNKRPTQANLHALTMARANEINIDDQINKAKAANNEALTDALVDKKKKYTDIRRAILGDQVDFDQVTGTPVVQSSFEPVQHSDAQINAALSSDKEDADNWLEDQNIILSKSFEEKSYDEFKKDYDAVQAEYEKRISDIHERSKFVPSQSSEQEAQPTTVEIVDNTPVYPQRQFVVKPQSDGTIGGTLNNRVTLNGVEGDLYVDTERAGNTVVFEGSDGKIREIGNADEIGSSAIEDFGLSVPEQTVTIEKNGNLRVDGQLIQPQLVDVKRDDAGNIREVTVLNNKRNGRRRTFKGQVAEDIAYHVNLKNILDNADSRQQFEQFINSDPAASTEVAAANEQPATTGQQSATVDDAGVPAAATEQTNGDNGEVSGQPAATAIVGESESEKAISILNSDHPTLKTDDGTAPLNVLDHPALRHMTAEQSVKFIAQQAQNVSESGDDLGGDNYQSTVNAFGREVVDAAIAAHPRESLLKQENAQQVNSVNPNDVWNDEKIFNQAFDGLTSEEQDQFRDHLAEGRQDEATTMLYDSLKKQGLVKEDAVPATAEASTDTGNGVSLDDADGIEALAKEYKPNTKAAQMIKSAQTIFKLLKSIIPNIELHLHRDQVSMETALSSLSVAADTRSDGTYSFGTTPDGQQISRIDIDLSTGNVGAIAHEATHAILHHVFNGSTELYTKFQESVSKVLSKSDNKRLTEFADNYNKDQAPEEYLAELSATLYKNRKGIGAILQNVKKLIDNIVSKAIGKKLYATTEEDEKIIKFFQSMNRAFTTGEIKDLQGITPVSNINTPEGGVSSKNRLTLQDESLQNKGKNAANDVSNQGQGATQASRPAQSASELAKRSEVQSAITKLRDQGVLKASDEEINAQMLLLDAMSGVWNSTTGQDNFYQTFISDVKQGDLTKLKNLGGALYQDESIGGTPASSAAAKVTLGIFSLPQFQKMAGQNVAVQSISDLVKGKGKQIEKDIINMVLGSDKYKGQKRIPFDDFRSDVEINTMKLERIRSKSYATYGMDNLGDDESYGEPQTIIFNSPIEHGQHGHFSADFSSVNTSPVEWELKQIPNTETWVAIDKNMPSGVEANQIANFVGTAGNMADVEAWINNRSETSAINTGLFGHIRRWLNKDDGIFYLAELQSDYFQKNKATDILADQIPQNEIDAHMNKNVWMPYDTEVAKKIEDKYGITVKQVGDRYEAYDADGTLLYYKDIDPEPLAGHEIGEFERVQVVALALGEKAEGYRIYEQDDRSIRLINHLKNKIPISFSNRDEANEYLEKIKPEMAEVAEYYSEVKRDYFEKRKEKKLEEQKYIRKRVEELKAAKGVNPYVAQFIASQKYHEARLIREALALAAEEGAEVMRFPTPYTLAVIEGYVDKSGSGNAPYDIISGDSDGLTEGDVIEYAGDRMIVVQSYSDGITVAKEDKVNQFSLQSFVREEAVNRVSEIEYEAKRHFTNLEEIDKAELDDYEPDEWMGEKAKELLLEDYEEASDLKEDGDNDPIILKWSDIQERLNDAAYETYDHMGVDDLFSWADQTFQDGDTVFVVEERGVTENFNQPDGYASDVSEDDYEDNLSDDQQTVVNKYKELNELLTKLRSEHEFVTDSNGMSWLEIKLNKEDKSNPVIAFQQEGGKVKGAVDFANENKATVHLFEGSDFSTLVHEMSGHLGRRFLDRLAEANKQFSKDYDAVKEWAGVKDNNWTTRSEEKFARAFERYLRDGNAPTEELKSVFGKIAEWLTNIYRSLIGSPIENKVDPEIKTVFDRLLGAQAASDNTNSAQIKQSKSNTVGEEMAGEKLPPVDEVYSILEDEEGRQGGNWLDNTYGDAKFESEADARKYAQEVHDFFDGIINNEKDIPIYRAVAADEVNLDPYSIGESWSVSLDAAKAFASHLGVPASKIKIISGEVPSQNVNWEQAIRNYLSFSDITDGDSEFELPVPANRVINNVQVADLKSSKQVTAVQVKQSKSNAGQPTTFEQRKKSLDIARKTGALSNDKYQQAIATAIKLTGANPEEALTPEEKVQYDNIFRNNSKPISLKDRIDALVIPDTGERSRYSATDTFAEAGFKSKGRPAKGEVTTIPMMVQANVDFINQLLSENPNAINDLMEHFGITDNAGKLTRNFDMSGKSSLNDYRLANVLFGFINQYPLSETSITPEQQIRYSKYLLRYSSELGRNIGQSLNVAKIKNVVGQIASDIMLEGTLSAREYNSISEAEDELMKILGGDETQMSDEELAASEDDLFETRMAEGEREKEAKQSGLLSKLLGLRKKQEKLSGEVSVEKSRKIVDQIDAKLKKTKADIVDILNKLKCD